MRITEPDPENQPTLDADQLQVLRNDMGDAADEVVAAYLETITGEIQQLRDSTGDTPSDDVRRYAHTLKSSALAVGAMRLAHLAARLEKAIHNGDEVELGAQVSALEAELEAYRAL